MNTIIHKFEGSQENLLGKLKQKYLPMYPPYAAPDYKGHPNPLLNAPITTAEVKAALQKIRRNSTPGQDQITNKALANLGERSVEQRVPKNKAQGRKVFIVAGKRPNSA